MPNAANQPSSNTMPQPFLARVAATYWNECKTDVSNYTFVFPYKRAGIFFRKYLAEVAQQPIFAPRICTINELFDELSPYRLTDSIDLLFRLYNIYNQKRPNQQKQERFDEFIFWGKMMLSDFNEIDQHLVDAKQLFSNLKDLKDIDFRLEQLGEEERRSVETFIRDMHSDKKNDYREKFLSLWDCLYPIYSALRAELSQEQLAYGGMQQRQVVEELQTDAILGERYIFIGFNALTETERGLMQKLKTAGKADFYWDYESEWLRDEQNQASYYFKRNTTRFPSRYTLPSGGPLTIPQIYLYKVPGSTGQAGQIYSILDQLPDSDKAEEHLRTGIVLPDEGMLLPLKTAIPTRYATINVTMGQQLKLTPIYSLVEHLSGLLMQQTTVGTETLFYYQPVLALLHHPYIYPWVTNQADRHEQDMLRNNKTYVPASAFADCQLLHALFFTASDNMDLLQHLQNLLQQLIHTTDEEQFGEQNEYIYRGLTVVNRLLLLLPRYPQISMEQKTLYKILLTLLAQEAVPFEGEPLQGLQIMGVLESRSMDFNTVIMTNCNDDIFPGSPQMNSFIPYDLRCYYHLPTPQREDAIFAYNFYRLISHAQRVYLLQNTISDDSHSGEVSRYVYQLQYQYNIPIETISISYSPSPAATTPPVVKKTAQMLRKLTTKVDPTTQQTSPRSLSPSALNTYVACPLHFYFSYVERLHEADQIADEIGTNQIGTVIHEVMEELYRPYACKGTPFIRTQITEDIIQKMIQQVATTSLVKQTYCATFLHTDIDNAHLSGWDNIMIRTITAYINKILAHDKTLLPFAYIASEQKIAAKVTLSSGHIVKLSGIADRIDEVNNQLRIIDYKTGSEHSKFPPLETLFSHNETDSDHVRQTLCYSMMFKATTGETECYPYIYYIKQSADNLEKEIAYAKKGEPELHGYQAMQQAFEQALQTMLEEIFNLDIPFEANPSDDNCKYCPFTQICGVKKKKW